ncbi:MAG: hypothetical protein ACHQ2Y_01895 [Candidatus Lutacidiplasmatales archaeon]
MSQDWELYRKLYRATDSPVWGAFPHPDLTTLAGELNTTRSTIWRRLKEWRRSGFVRGYETIPNPGLFGVGLLTNEVRLADPRSRQRFLDELELIDGVFLANFDLGPRTMVVSVADMSTSQARRRELIRRIPGVESVLPPNPVWLPTCRRQLSIGDWRLISALRESPESSVVDLAGFLGVSAKTFSRRYRALRESHALLSYRVEDFTRFPGTVATFLARLHDGVDSRETAVRFEESMPGLLEIAHIDRPPFSSHNVLAYSLFVSSAASMEEAEAAALEVPGVVGVRTIFMGGERAYRGWFDERINQAMHGPLPRAEAHPVAPSRWIAMRPAAFSRQSAARGVHPA